jgi:hypothetical protein
MSARGPSIPPIRRRLFAVKEKHLNPSPEARALQREPQFFIERRSLRRRILDRAWPIAAFALALAWWWFK